MRLTTRLMQLASWLLLQRAIGSGEMSIDEARREKHRISLSDIGRGNMLSGSEQLPRGLTEIVDRSLALHQRVLKLDAMLNMQAKSEDAAAASPVNSQIDRIAAVFNAGRA
jgi:regulator of CtrA degradation